MPGRREKVMSDLRERRRAMWAAAVIVLAIPAAAQGERGEAAETQPLIPKATSWDTNDAFVLKTMGPQEFYYVMQYLI
jgi:hypothetical protein